MVTKAELTNNMTDWVSLAEAARIWGVDASQVTRRMQQGRLTVRVSNGRKFLFRKELEEFKEIKKGNPNLIDHANGDAIDHDTWSAIEQEIARVAARNSDAVFQAKVKGSKCSLEVLALDEGRWEQFDKRKIA